MAPKNKFKKSLIPKTAPLLQSHTNYIGKDVAVLQNWDSNGDKTNVFVSIRYLQSDFQCFFEWEKDEMAQFWEFNRKIHEITWELLYRQSGKGENKSGFAITPIPRDKYPPGKFIDSLDPEINMIELRVNQKSRVHGFRNKPFFYLCYLDRNHEICA